MAWWDHEELKDPRYRSDRYITAFPSEYKPREVIAAAKRRLEEEMGDRVELERLIAKMEAERAKLR